MKKLILITVLLSGCGSIPTSGPVSDGLEVADLDRNDEKILTVQGPRKGDSPIEIVEGFLAATVGSIRGSQISREYLAEVVSFDWELPKKIRVFETELSLNLIDESVVNAIGIPKLTLDDYYRPKLSQSSQSQSISFSLIREGGEWRIINPPDALLISKADFERNFGISYLWFPSEALDALIPEPIAYSQFADPALQLIRALSNYLPDLLPPKAVNLISPSRIGGLSSLQKVGDRVLVDLDAKTMQLKIEEKLFLVGQLAQTLASIDGISQLEIAVEGQLLSIVGVENPVNLSMGNWPGSRTSRLTNLYATSKSNQLIQPASGISIDSWIPQIMSPKNLAVTKNEQQFAVFEPNRNRIALGSLQEIPITINNVSGVSNLNFDFVGKLWFVDSTNQAFYRFDGTNLAVADVNLPPRSFIAHAIVSPDRSRVALISQSGSRATLSVFRLVETENKVSLRNRSTILNFIGSVDYLNWFNATEVALLVSFPNQRDRVAVVVNIATAAQKILRVPEGTNYLSANGFGVLAAQDSRQQIWLLLENEWQRIGQGISPAFPAP